MKTSVKENLCMISALIGMLLMMGAEGGDKAGSLSFAATVGLLLLGLAMIALPMLVLWLSDEAGEDESKDTQPAEEWEDAA